MILRYTSVLLMSVALLSLAVSAQHPNAPGARLVINSADGPPFPIVNVLIPNGSSVTIQIQGDPNTPIILASTPTLQLPGTPYIGGIVDLDLSNPAALQVPFNGFATPSLGLVTDGTGSFQLTFPVITGWPPLFQIAYQALVQNASSLFGMRLTAATSVILTTGITTIPLPMLGSDNCVQIQTLGQFGFLLPFYSTAYSDCFVCSNGFISFTGPSSDFTPTDMKMHTELPRIALFWADLSPNHPTYGGNVSVIVNQNDPSNPLFTVVFYNVPDWPTGLGPGATPIVHDAAAVLDIASGDIAIVHYATTNASYYDTMIGITAGFALDPTGAGSMDLSAALAAGADTGLPDEGFYEGFMGLLSVTGWFTAPYDLLGQKILFTAVNPGMASASYVMKLIP